MNSNYYQQGIEHLEMGRLRDAEEAFISFLQEKPDDAMGYNKLGIVYGRISDFERAKACFFKALELDKDIIHAWNNLGNIARQEGDIEQAKEYYQKAIAIDPTNPIPARNLRAVERHLKWSPAKLLEIFRKKGP